MELVDPPREVVPAPVPGGRSVTVVITCYTEDRWETLLLAIDAVRGQTVPCDDVVVVVDHAPELMERLRREGGNGFRVVPNHHPRGASGARNTGAEVAGSEFIVFLDDDQEPDQSWLAALLEARREFPDAVGFGGAIEPHWPSGQPSWFPPAFNWVVGATTPGRPAGFVRNVWGGNTLVERTAFLASGGYNTAFGKLGAVSEPEDTELCLRMTARAGGARWRFVPTAVVVHHVPPARATRSYFVHRCWLEGRGKRAMAALGGMRDLAEESAFARTALTRGVARDVRSALGGDPGGWARAAASVVGTTSAFLAFALPVPRSPGRRPPGGRRRGITRATLVPGSGASEQAP